MKEGSTVHNPIAAGILYPSEADALQRVVDSLLAEGADLLAAGLQASGFLAPQLPSAEVPSATLPADRAPEVLIVPHAAYQHAGRYMGAAFAALLKGSKETNEAIRRVVLLSTLHRDSISFALLPVSSVFRTPSAELSVDTDMVGELLEDAAFISDETYFSEEHAQEVLLPFIGRCLPNAVILPVLLGDNSPGLAVRTSRALRSCGLIPGEDTLFVISTNLSRFVRSETALDQSRRFIEALTAGSGKLLEHLDTVDTSSACGIGAVRTAVLCCDGDLRFHLVSTGSSGRIPPEQREVWYGSLCGYWKKSEQEE